jgi:hypothetical protein
MKIKKPEIKLKFQAFYLKFYFFVVSYQPGSPPGGGAGEVSAALALFGLLNKIIVVAAETAIKPAFLMASLRVIFLAIESTFFLILLFISMNFLVF